MSNYLPLGTLSFLYVGKSSWTPAVTGKSDFNVGLYRLKPHGGPPDAQQGCPETSSELLPEVLRLLPFWRNRS